MCIYLEQDNVINCVFVVIDENECCIDTSCHEKSVCENFVGKFTCNCSTGYTGNGTYCEGELLILHLHRFSIQMLLSTHVIF